MKIALRLMSAVIGLLLLALTLFIPFSQSSLTADTREVSVDVKPLPLKIVCPGAMVEVAGQSGVEVGKIERVGTARLWSQGSSGAQVEERSENAYPIDAEGDSQSTALLSAIQTQVVDRNRAAGLMAGYCEQPASSGWFAAGDGGTGRESVLVVNNPSEVDSQLMLEFHFAGKVVTERFVIAGLSDKLISLAAIVGVEPSYALYFESGGGPLSVALQHRYSDGLTPLGVSLTTAIREPATELWIAPVDVLAEGFEKPRLRIFAPKNAANVSITIPGTGFALTEVVESGSMKELELNLTSGVFALKIESDEVVVAQLLNPSLSPLDYSWLSSLEPMSAIHMPLSNFNQELALLNPTDRDLEIELVTRSALGSNLSQVTLAPGKLLMLPISGTSFTAKADGTFMSALRILDDVGYEVINPSENSNLGQSLRVLVR
jgi:molybdopterin-binding protein